METLERKEDDGLLDIRANMVGLGLRLGIERQTLQKRVRVRVRVL